MYRDDLSALAARHAALETELAHKTQELAEATRTLEEARAVTRLPVLANIRVAAPCPAAWDAMTGDDRVRLCGQCNKNVYNLSDLTRAEAEALLVEKAGRLCVNYYQRKDGTILLKDCSVGISQRRRRRAIAVGALALLAGGGALGSHLALRGAESLEPGEVAYEEQPAPGAEYRIVHNIEEPPEEVEMVVVPAPPAPEDFRDSERTGGAVVEMPVELDSPLGAK
jgi:hypothetical protein